MPLQLLPASAQAFAPRAPPTIVLGTKVEQWLTQALKRINRVKRPLNSVPQHFRNLTETLGGAAAIWTLTSLMLPKAPDADLRKDDNPLIEALFNYQLVHVEAYVVHVDMVSQMEVAFKLTPETIEALTEYHKDIYSADTFADTWSWPEKEAQLKKLQDEFVQAVNKFVYRTGVRVLEGLEEDGAGEVLDQRAKEVKTLIGNLFVPLLPPPPRIVDVLHPTPMLALNVMPGHWWTPPPSLAPQPIPVDSWKVLPSTPSPTVTSCSDTQSNAFWPSEMNNLSAAQLPSPTPSYSQPTNYTSAPFFNSPQAITSIPTLHLPSTIPSHCGTDLSMGHYDSFGWSASSFPSQYATAV